MKNAWVFLADGFEDIEAVTPIDLLRRAGITVTAVALKGHEAVSARGLRVACDASLAEMLAKALPDLAVLPGGGAGSRNLAASTDLEKFVKKLFAEGKLVGAICAAPAVALGSWGLLTGKKYTCFPGMGEDLPVKPQKARVVVDGNLVTSQAAGSAEEFSLALIGALCGKDAAEKVASEIHARR
jgi:4-methyl-5(b-hydroxyethyl)-thiazole monophosphate biosynthesis